MLTHRPSRTLYLVNGQNKLVSRVEMQDFALAEPLQTLSELSKHIKAFVNPTDPKEEVVEKMELELANIQNMVVKLKKSLNS